jgi:hypothetical protein
MQNDLLTFKLRRKKHFTMHVNIGTSNSDISNSCDIGFNYNKNDPVSQMVFLARACFPQDKVLAIIVK